MGVMWNPRRDSFNFHVCINLSPLKKKSRAGPDLSKAELVPNPPERILRRQYYSQVQALFDLTRFLLPVVPQGKVYLCKTWELDCKDLDWDKPLAKPVTEEIVQFFVPLFELEQVKFSRSLRPQDKIVSQPELVICSNRSFIAFSTVVYI